MLELIVNKAYSYEELKIDYTLIRFHSRFSLFVNPVSMDLHYFKHYEAAKDKPHHRFYYQSKLEYNLRKE